MRRILFLLLVLSLSIIIIGCGKNSEDISKDIIGVRGKIKEMQMDEKNNEVSRFLVEGEKEEDVTYDSAYVTIDNHTEFYKAGVKCTLEDIEEGAIVEVIFDGAVVESYPVQGTAKKIKILDY